MSKQPTPVRFSESEDKVVDLLCQRTGLSAAEVIRRAIRLLYRETISRGGDTSFIIALTPTNLEMLLKAIPTVPDPHAEEVLRVAEQHPEYNPKSARERQRAGE